MNATNTMTAAETTPKTFNQFRVYNTISNEHAAKLTQAIHGKTYMNFQVLVCRVGGSFDVLVETDYDAPREEISEMLMFLMCSIIRRA